MQGDEPCHDRSRDWSDRAESWGTLRLACRHQSWARGMKQLPPESLEGINQPCWHLHFRLLDFRTVKEYVFDGLRHPVLCYNCPGLLHTLFLERLGVFSYIYWPFGFPVLWKDPFFSMEKLHLPIWLLSFWYALKYYKLIDGFPSSSYAFTPKLSWILSFLFPEHSELTSVWFVWLFLSTYWTWAQC